MSGGAVREIRTSGKRTGTPELRSAQTVVPFSVLRTWPNVLVTAAWLASESAANAVMLYPWLKIEDE
jgi:hypothetical protein